MTDRAALVPTLRSVLARVELRNPGAPEDIQFALSAAARPLPEDYLAFLRASDGAEGWIGKNYLQVAGARSAAETTMAFAQWVPGLFFFASDGAEGLFAFDLRDDGRRVAITHTDDLELEGLVYAAESFTTFLGFLQHTDWSNFWFAERSRRRRGPAT